MKFVQFSLPFKEANAFIQDCLDQGNELAQLIKKNVNFNEGTLVAYLPSGTDSKTLISFKESAHFLSSDPLKILTNEILDFLELENNVCLLEHSLAYPTDLWIKKCKDVKIVTHEGVFALLLHGVTKEEIIKSIRTVESYLLIGMMSSVKDNPEIKRIESIIETKDLEELVHNVRKLIIGAYDGDSYIIWHRN